MFPLEFACVFVQCKRYLSANVSLLDRMEINAKFLTQECATLKVKVITSYRLLPAAKMHCYLQLRTIA